MESTKINTTIFPKFIGVNDKIGLGGIVMLTATIIQLLIQIPLYRPLYLLANKNRYAILIVFYKACCSLPISLQTIFGNILITDPELPSNNAWVFLAISIKLALKLLVLLFTFCRFWAIIFPWGYARIWNKKRIQIYAILTILISFVLGFSATTCIKTNGGFLLDMYAYISQFSILFAIALYIVTIIRLIVQKCTMLQNTVENDRIKIMIVCLASMMPMLIDQLPLYLLEINRIVNPNVKSIVLPSWFPLLQVNQVMMKGFDEYVLLLVCADFRALVKKELANIFGKFRCKKYRIANTTRQLNHQPIAISTNSWMRDLNKKQKSMLNRLYE